VQQCHSLGILKPVEIFLEGYLLSLAITALPRVLHLPSIQSDSPDRAPMTLFTAAIRTYNGADRLPLLLESLRDQIDADTIDWEVVIVDNNSTDQTAQVIQAYQQNWPQQIPFHYIFEPQQGAAIARRRAIQAAQGKFIGFLDDDNIPAANWVAAAVAFSQAHPRAGAFGSRILPVYEVEPPPNFGRIAHYLPTMERKNSFHYDSYKRGLPVGAGLVIHKQAWLENVPADLIIQGPIGKGFGLKGEETEGLSHLKASGWELWYNAEMVIHHHIPKWRLEREYLLNFYRTIGRSQHRFRMLRHQLWQRPLVFPLLIANDCQKILLHYLQHHSTIHADIVTACELQFLLGRLFSPFYVWHYLRAKQLHHESNYPVNRDRFLR
jgi:glycosyltransferase involved in cell wall biosynthesis